MSQSPPAILYLAATSDGAVDHLRGAVAWWRRDNRLAPVHLLLPSAAVIHDVRQILGSTLNVHFHQFYNLGHAILQSARQPVYELDDAAIRRLVHTLLDDMDQTGRLSSFRPVWDKPGFTQVMIGWLREMKSQGIPVEAVETHARGERDTQLAYLYRRYQEFLQDRGASDAEGLLWLAATCLEQDGRLFRHAGPFYVLGFDQFNPIQLRLLRQLGGRFRGFSVYLTWDPDRPARSLALTRLSTTRRQLLDRLELEERVVGPGAADETAPTLVHLRQTLFEPISEDRRPSNGAAIRFVEAPSREEEVRWALRAIKRLLLTGERHSNIALSAPQPGIYRRLVETVAAEYGVPVQVERTLATSPVVSALLTLLGLYPDFPWRQTFRVLRSPYIRQPWLTADQIDRLDQLTRERPVVAGIDQWQFALRPLRLASPHADEDEDRSRPPLVSQLPVEELAALEADLCAFFDRLTPPQAGDHRSYTLWLQQAILGICDDELNPDQAPEVSSEATLDMLACCKEGPYAERDLHALSLVTRTLRRMVTAADLVPVGAGRPLSWQAFYSELAGVLPAETISPDPYLEAIPFEPVEARRARAVDHLFVLGLSEGEFPGPPPADVLYGPGEREHSPLPLRRPVEGDAACLWWQVVGNCRKQLTLLRPWSDENGAEWPASPYWTEVSTQFRDTVSIRIPAADHLAVDDAASIGELLVALAVANAERVPGELSSLWGRAVDAGALTVQRQSWREPGVYEGLLRAPDIRERLAYQFGAQHVWSASRLNRYGSCPYGFFAEHILDLDPRPDPEEGLDAAQRGSILHAILEHLYRGLSEGGIQPTAETEAEVLSRLEEACTTVYRDAPQRYGFRPDPLWEHEQAELRRLLVALSRWECQQNQDGPAFLPYRQEVGFGVAHRPPVWVADESGAGFFLRGFIDRVDRDAQGRLRVLDYKSGSSTYSVATDVRGGLALQTALYALAAEELLGGSVAESAYLHIPTRNKSGALSFADGVLASPDLLAAVAAAAGSVARIRLGIFPSAPAHPQGGNLSCSSWCRLAPVCRVTRRSIAKARRLLSQE